MSEWLILIVVQIWLNSNYRESLLKHSFAKKGGISITLHQFYQWSRTQRLSSSWKNPFWLLLYSWNDFGRTLSFVLTPLSPHTKKYWERLPCIILRALSLLVSDLVLGNQRFLVRVQLLAMCRGEHSAVITRLISKCLRSVYITAFVLSLYKFCIIVHNILQ